MDLFLTLSFDEHINHIHKIRRLGGFYPLNPTTLYAIDASFSWMFGLPSLPRWPCTAEVRPDHQIIRHLIWGSSSSNIFLATAPPPLLPPCFFVLDPLISCCMGKLRLPTVPLPITWLLNKTVPHSRLRTNDMNSYFLILMCFLVIWRHLFTYRWARI